MLLTTLVFNFFKKDLRIVQKIVQNLFNFSFKKISKKLNNPQKEVYLEVLKTGKSQSGENMVPC